MVHLPADVGNARGVQPSRRRYSQTTEPHTKRYGAVPHGNFDVNFRAAFSGTARRLPLKTARSAVILFFGFLTCSMQSGAQTVQVDITPAHATNHFAPNQTLGAGVDRIPQEAIDKGLAQPSLDRVLRAGWGAVS